MCRVAISVDRPDVLVLVEGDLMDAKCKRCGRPRNPVGVLMGAVCLPCTKELHAIATGQASK